MPRIFKSHLLASGTLLVVYFILIPAISCFPLRQWPLIPDRQLHWSGLLHTTRSDYVLPKASSTTETEYQAFLRTKSSGQNPRATFRPDTWSRYNYHLERRDLGVGSLISEQLMPPSVAMVLEATESAKCNESLTPNHYCPKTPAEIANDFFEMRRGLAAGTTVAILGGLLIAFIYLTQHKFFKYFNHKDRWFVERARERSIKLVNMNLIKSGIDDPFPENLDEWVLSHPPSKFWARIFESEGFIGFLLWLERITKLKGKWTSIMTRPKLGDEASRIPLNSERARRRYARKRRSVKKKASGDLGRVSGAELPVSVNSLRRRGRLSRFSVGSLRTQSSIEAFSTPAIASTMTTSPGSSVGPQDAPDGLGRESGLKKTKSPGNDLEEEGDEEYLTV